MTPSRLIGPGFFVLVLLGFTAAPMLAQPADEVPAGEDAVVIHSRNRARARFEASQANVKDLARRRTDAIRQVCRLRMQEYIAGRGILDAIIESQRLLASSQQPPRAKTDVNREAFEENWRTTWEVEQITKFRFEANQVKAADYHDAVYRRLDAELQLALSRPKKK